MSEQIATLPGPAAAPAAMPAPAGATQASISTGPSEPASPAGDSMSDAFSKLDARGQDLEQIATARPPTAKPKVPTKPTNETKSVENKTASAEKGAEAVKTIEQPTKKPPNKELEDAVAAPKPGETVPAEKPKTGWARFHEAEKQIKDLTAKLEAKEKASTMPDDHPELVRMRGEIQKREQRLAEVESHLRYKDYEASKEYQTDYHKPYMEIATHATNRATQLKVKNEIEGTSRLLTVEEFWSVVHQPDEEAANQAAKAIFGDDSSKVSAVVERRNEILLAHQRAEGAKAAAKRDGAEITRKKQEEVQRQGTERSTLFKKLMTDGIEKDPALYKPEEGDAEGNTLLENGFRLVDRVFSGGPPDVDGGTPMSPQEMIAAHAEIRNQAAAFPRIAHKYKAAVARILELEESLSQYEASTPAKGEAVGEGQKAKGDDMESLLGGLDKYTNR